MISNLTRLEFRCLDQMTRPELIAAIELQSNSLGLNLPEQLKAQPTDCLRLLLLSTRLLHVLRHLLGREVGNDPLRDPNRRF
jgi:hypothetical protein